jgi:hypothetical protein
MKFTGIQGIIRRNQKNMKMEGDSLDKKKVQDFLRTHHIYALEDKYVLFDKEYGYFLNVYDGVTDEQAKITFWHKPDLFIKPDIVIEIDGWEIHGGNDELTMSTTTRLRNKHYLDAELKLVVIDKETLNVLGITWEQYLTEEFRSLGLIA